MWLTMESEALHDYRAFALRLGLKEPPVKVIAHLKMGGSLVGVELAGGIIVSATEETWLESCRNIIQRGPQWEGFTAAVPLEPEYKPIFDELSHQVEEVRKYSDNGPLSKQLQATGRLPHADRVRLMMSMLHAGRSDDEIHAVFRHAENYRQDRTSYFLAHARRAYL